MVVERTRRKEAAASSTLFDVIAVSAVEFGQKTARLLSWQIWNVSAQMMIAGNDAVSNSDSKLHQQGLRLRMYGDAVTPRKVNERPHVSRRRA